MKQESSPNLAGCPACASLAAPSPVEEHFDKIGGRRYQLVSCPGCGIVWTQPRQAVGADWYKKLAPIRDLERRPAPETNWRFQQFFSDELRPGRLLDVGCGDGGFLGLAAERGFTPVGFDYDERVIAKAKAKGLSDVHAMEFSDFLATRKKGEFDAMTMFEVLEHTPEPAWFIGQLKPLLKQGGHIAITLPNRLRPLPWGREKLDFPPHHFTRWTPEVMRGFLERQGFEIVRQNARFLPLSYLSDHFFFFRLMPGVLALARKLLFPGRGSPGATLTELYDQSAGAPAGLLGNKLRRKHLANAASRCFQLLFIPVGLCLRFYYRLREPNSGDCIYTLARYRG